MCLPKAELNTKNSTRQSLKGQAGWLFSVQLDWLKKVFHVTAKTVYFHFVLQKGNGSSIYGIEILYSNNFKYKARRKLLKLHSPLDTSGLNLLFEPMKHEPVTCIRFYAWGESLFFQWIELNSKNSTKQPPRPSGWFFSLQLDLRQTQ